MRFFTPPLDAEVSLGGGRSNPKMAAPPTPAARREAGVPIWMSSAQAAARIELAKLESDLGLGLSRSVEFAESPTHRAALLKLAELRKSRPEATYTEALLEIAPDKPLLMAAARGTGEPPLAWRALLETIFPGARHLVGADRGIWEQLRSAVKSGQVDERTDLEGVLKRLVKMRETDPDATLADAMRSVR